MTYLCLIAVVSPFVDPGVKILWLVSKMWWRIALGARSLDVCVSVCRCVCFCRPWSQNFVTGVKNWWRIALGARSNENFKIWFLFSICKSFVCVSVLETGVFCCGLVPCGKTVAGGPFSLCLEYTYGVVCCSWWCPWWTALVWGIILQQGHFSAESFRMTEANFTKNESFSWCTECSSLKSSFASLAHRLCAWECQLITSTCWTCVSSKLVVNQ